MPLKGNAFDNGLKPLKVLTSNVLNLPDKNLLHPKEKSPKDRLMPLKGKTSNTGGRPEIEYHIVLDTVSNAK